MLDFLRRAHGKAPRLTKLYVEPTSRCNLECRTCMRHTWDETGGDLAADTFDRLVDSSRSIPSLETVAFWGIGEPLMHPAIAAMIGRVKALGLKTELITNGLLLTPAISGDLVAAGLDTLVVSLDGASRAANTDLRPGCDIEAVQRNIDGLHRAKQRLGRATPELGIEFVVMRRNLRELSLLPDLAKRLGARFVIVSNLLPYSGELREEILYWLASGHIHVPDLPKSRSGVLLPPIDARPEYLPHLDIPGARSYGVRQHKAHRLAVDGHCPFVEVGSLAVAWNGAVSPCVPLMHSHACFVLGREKQVRRYEIGNLRERSLAEIWRTPEHRAFQRRVLDFDFSPCLGCGGCELVESNLEDCFGNPHPTCGDCLWSRGIVLCP